MKVGKRGRLRRRGGGKVAAKANAREVREDKSDAAATGGAHVPDIERRGRTEKRGWWVGGGGGLDQGGGIRTTVRQSAGRKSFDVH